MTGVIEYLMRTTAYMVPGWFETETGSWWARRSRGMRLGQAWTFTRGTWKRDRRYERAAAAAARSLRPADPGGPLVL